MLCESKKLKRKYLSAKQCAVGLGFGSLETTKLGGTVVKGNLFDKRKHRTKYFVTFL